MNAANKGLEVPVLEMNFKTKGVTEIKYKRGFKGVHEFSAAGNKAPFSFHKQSGI